MFDNTVDQTKSGGPNTPPMSPTCNTLRSDRVRIMNFWFGPNSGSNKGFSCYNRKFLPLLGLPKIPRAIIKGYILRDKKTRHVISRILGQRAKKRNPFTF